MKKSLIIIPAVILALTTGCASENPDDYRNTEEAANGIYEIACMTVKEPDDHFDLYDNKDVLAEDGLHYITWTSGSPTEYTNSDGNVVNLFDAQLYLLVKDCSTDEAAATEISGWQSIEAEAYNSHTTQNAAYNNQDYTLLFLSDSKKDSPYSEGISAYTTYNSYAVCIELYCCEDFNGDLSELLDSFLNGCTFD